MLPSGADGVRFRPALTVSRAEIGAAVAGVRAALLSMAEGEQLRAVFVTA